VALDLSHAQPAGIQRNDLVVEAGPAGLVLGHQLRLERTLAITRNLQRQLAEIPLERLAAVAIAGIAAGVGDRLALVVAQVIRHLSL
jgi:hypothetical protein